MSLEIHPVPTDAEAAAIAAAVGVALLSGGPAAPEPAPVSNRWRFSGRWWADPVPRSRRRP